MEKAVLFWSGGKDASKALYQVQQEGNYDVVGLVTTMNTAYRRVSMHGVREEMIERQAKSIGIPLLKMWVPESPTNALYEAALLELYGVLREQEISTVIYGDIFLEDLRAYREQLAASVGMKLYFPLWGQSTAILLQEMLEEGFKAITCCIDAMKLDKCFLGKEVDVAFVHSLPESVDSCGENGEFHTFCFEGPVFSQKIVYTLGEEKFVQIENGGFWYVDAILLTNS